MKTYKLKHKKWQVPSFEYSEFFPKRTKYCFCPHVINEGKRIKAQLQKMKKLSKDIDIIIADGGSTDGSLNHNYLKKCGVKALLVKKGPGRLSAQMRMAMAYAMEQGYEGIVFIDGNNKDDTTAVYRFMKKLDEGYDYVQGSRFIKGGKAVNTPFERFWGIRMVHAPILSLFSGKWQTDTTNGFKAYSRKMLLDPKIAPFRKILSEYEMHYYLAIRAPHLKYKLCEVPVTRSYPSSGEVPTKISPIKGMFKLFMSLFKACFGVYNPKHK